LPPPQLTELVDQALSRRLATDDRVVAALEAGQRAPGRAGTVALRAALLVWSDRIIPGSAAETRLLRSLTSWGYEAPERQVVVRDDAGRFLGRLDLAWRDARIGVEYDSDEWHAPRRWDHDAARDDRFGVAGWWVRHVGKGDLQPSCIAFLRSDLDGRLARPTDAVA
jgi:hypothetical protein